GKVVGALFATGADWASCSRSWIRRCGGSSWFSGSRRTLLHAPWQRCSTASTRRWTSTFARGTPSYSARVIATTASTRRSPTSSRCSDSRLRRSARDRSGGASTASEGNEAMCGIMGYIGGQQAWDIVLSGLKRLEYRGYDSAGVVTLSEQKLRIARQVGHISALEAAQPEPLPGTLGIGHTRWATHGGVSVKNCHPHRDSSERVAIVHNGISDYME